MRIICLANSWKEGGRCVAGIDPATGRWVRPVSREGHGQLSLSETRVHVSGSSARQIEPLDLAELGNVRSCPIPGQPENVELLPGSMKFIRKVEAAAIDRYVVRGREILHGTGSFVDCEQAAGVRSSLALIRVDDPQFVVRHNKFRQQLRVLFDREGVAYDLPVTDASAWANQARIDPDHFSVGRWYLTVSLGVPFHEKMYKLVACAIFVP